MELTTPTPHQPWPWPHLDAARARELLAPHFGGDAAALEPLGHGDFCIAFRVGDHVLRVARHAQAAAALAREGCVLAAVALRLPLPVPRPALRGPPDCPPFSTHVALDGAVLTRAGWERMSPPAQQRIAAQLAAFLHALHAQPVAALDGCNLEHLDDRAAAQRLLPAAGGAAFASLDPHLRSRLTERLELIAGRRDPSQPPVLLHRDIAPGHVLCDEDTGVITGIIDFGDVAIGNPARDFIYIYEDFGPALLSRVATEYAGSAAPGLLHAVREQYLLDVVAWTIDVRSTGDDEELRHAVGVIERELRES